MDESLYKWAKKHFSHDNVLSEYDLIDDELRELRKRKIKKILEQQYTLETLGLKYKDLKMIAAHNAAKIKLATAIEHNNLFCFITINPKPGITLPQFIKKIEKLANRSIFTECTYVYEQRGKTESEMGKGMHAHLLAKRNLNYKPSKVRELIQNTVKTLVKSQTDPRWVNVRHLGENWAKDKKEYIMGTKTGSGKDIKQDFDKIWRLKNNLKVYYNNAKNVHQENAKSKAPNGENSQ